MVLWTIDLGLNYRMTELQAALGISQMSRIDDFVLQRNNHASFYKDKLSSLDIFLPPENPKVYSSFHLFIVKIKSQSSAQRRVIFDYMKKENIGVNVHYIPIHLQPYYKKLKFKKGDYPISETYYNSAISIPLYPHIEEIDIKRVVMELSKALELNYKK